MSKSNAAKKVEQLPLTFDSELVFKFWKSSLFNEVYLKNDLKNKYKDIWDFDEAGPFYEFLNSFKNLCVDLEDDDFHTWSETETINNWIKPIMKYLGWEPRNNVTMEEVSFTIPENGKKKTYRADILYVADPKVKKIIKDEKDQEKRRLQGKKHIEMPVEAKYWDRLEQYRQGKKETSKKLAGRKKKDDDNSLSPEEQTLKYMEILEKDYGILTDGKTWKLLHLRASNDSMQRCFEFDLGDLMEFYLGNTPDSIKHPILEEAAKFFYFFFSKPNIIDVANDEPILDEVLEFSEQYIDMAEENLKGRFLQAMNIACNGFRLSMIEEGEEEDLSLIRAISECHLFNMLFIKNCEVKYILPLDNLEYRKYSLTSVIEKLDIVGFDPSVGKDVNELPLIRAFKNDFKYTHDGNQLYKRLIDLTKIIHSGTKGKVNSGFEIKGFKESVFSKEEWAAVRKYSLTNYEVVTILFQLGFAESKVPGRLFQQIPYNAFSPRQLGSIYESFLEFKLKEADANYEFKKSGKTHKWIKSKLAKKKFDALMTPKVEKGDLYFATDNEDRRATGSYYTPDWVVQYIVEKVLGPAVEGKSSSEIKKIKACDPSMGSGHFLNAALNFLTKAYLKALREEKGDNFDMTTPKAKRDILDSCIFGVDLNERAVKLAQLSLWLESAHPDLKLERLDDQIKYGNSLIPKSEVKNGEKRRWKVAFDWEQFDTENMYFIGNPPWGATISEETRNKIAEIYGLDKDNLNSFEAFLLLPSVVGSLKTMYIIPRNFIRTNDYEGARKKLLEEQNLLSVGDFGACFEGVTQEAVTVEYSGIEIPKKGVELVPFAKDEDFKVYGYIKQKQILDDSKTRFNLLYTEELEHLAGKMECETVSLTDYVEHFRGIEYGKNGEVTECTSCGSYNSLPKKKNKTKKCHSCDETISIDDAEVYNFINKDRTTRHKTPIVVGKVIERYGCKEFYYMEKGVKGIDYKERAFRDGEKILLMKISESLKGYLDFSNSYTTQGIYMLYLKDEFKGKVGLGSILGILNSSLMKFYYEYRVNMGATLTTNVIFDDILKLPMPVSEALSSKEMKSIDKEVRSLQTALKNGSKTKIQASEAKIEELVFQAFGISKKEQKVIHAFLEKFKSLNIEAENDDEEDAA